MRTKIEINKLSETIKGYTDTKDKSSFVFLGYFTLFTVQSKLTFIKGVSMNDMYKHLERSLEENSFTNILLDKIEDLIPSIDRIMKKYEEMYPKEQSERIIENWNTLGYSEIKREYESNKNSLTGLNKVIEGFNQVPNLNIEDLIDLFELLNISDRSLNDFFTPNDISKLVSTLSVSEVKGRSDYFDNKNEINFIDMTCGIGRLLYHSYVEVRERYPNKEINVFGIDIYPSFAVFTSSIMNLINLHHTHIVIGDSLTIEPNFPKMDFSVGNPPFGQVNKRSWKNLNCLLEYVYRVNGETKNDIYKKSLKEMKKINVEPINQTDYEEIVSDYRVV